MKLKDLIINIELLHRQTQKFAVQQINLSLTIRNWLIGYYIVEYEQKGAERAKYNKDLLNEIAGKLKKIQGLGSRNLYLYKSFYLTYPLILQTLSAKSSARGHALPKYILSGLLSSANLQGSKLQTLSANSPTRKKSGIQGLSADVLLGKLSFSHFIELIKSDTEIKRIFYEVQSVKNNWSVLN